MLPFARSLQYGSEGRADGLTARHTTEREKWFVFSKPLVSADLVFFKKKSTLVNDQRLADLKDLNIGQLSATVILKTSLQQAF